MASRQVSGLDPTSYAYEARGRLISSTDGSGASARTRSYTYGADGLHETAPKHTILLSVWMGTRIRVSFSTRTE